MQRYLGTKLIAGQPMSRQDYNDYRGWKLPSDEDGTDPGYLVEYLDSPDSNHPNHKHYISWSPRGPFENAYRLTKGLTFGLALEALKKGQSVLRQGWDGKGIFIKIKEIVSHDDSDNNMTYPYIYIDTTNLITENPDALLDRVPWLASQTDMLAEDWVIL